MKSAGFEPTGNRLRGALRVNGLAVLLGIVVVGLATGAGFYRYQRGAMEARLADEMAAAPTSTDERLALWLRVAGPQIHHRLAVVGRFAPDMPWLVTHAVAPQGGGAPENRGVDRGHHTPDRARHEERTGGVQLPRPGPLGRARLEGERAQRVPIYPPSANLDPVARLSELALYLLEGIPKALTRDVQGAALEIRVRAVSA